MTRKYSLALIAATVVTLGSSAIASAEDFRSPSGNITCWIDTRFARCDIDEHDWKPPPKPASCQLAYGFGLSVGKRGRGDFVCAGGTAGDPSRARTLPYGKSIRRGRYRCTSRRSGIGCVNRRTRHGFKLSKGAAVRF